MAQLPQDLYDGINIDKHYMPMTVKMLKTLNFVQDTFFYEGIPIKLFNLVGNLKEVHTTGHLTTMEIDDLSGTLHVHCYHVNGLYAFDLPTYVSLNCFR